MHGSEFVRHSYEFLEEKELDFVVSIGNIIGPSRTFYHNFIGNMISDRYALAFFNEVILNE